MKPKVFGEHDDVTLEQFYNVADSAEFAALMADGHRGYLMPIGGVAAYDNKVSPNGVGVDIGCGNMAVKTDVTLDEFADISREQVDDNPYKVLSNPKLNDLADEIWHRIQFGPGRVNREDDAPRDHELFLDDRWYILPNTGGEQAFRDELREKARDQLGTVGGGNHYVDVFVDDDNYIWVGVHFGSRGFGHTIAMKYLALAQGGTWDDYGDGDEEVILHRRNPIGYDYWQMMELAVEYAYAGREWATRKVVDIIGANEVDVVHNNHNFATEEEHMGRELVVIRKGATPAFTGQRGFVGGSVGDNAVILEGAHTEEGSKEHWLQKQSLFSTVHGAGRVMGRREAKRTVDESEVEEWLDGMGVIRRGGGLDESPQAYRRLSDVLDIHSDTINVLHELRPIIVCMAND